MHKVQIANLLLTRRCNLKCDYCGIIRDIPEVEDYPTMKHYSDNELKADQWIDIIQRLKANNKFVFLVIYGGEPFLYKDLWKILDFCNKEEIFYTVISNNTDGVQKRILDVYNKIGTLKGFTSSVDPIMFSDIDEWEDVKTKSIVGMQRLSEIKNNSIAEDVVAEITVLQSTVQYLYKTVKCLSDNGIYSSITTLDQQKSSHYDFSTISDETELVQKSPEVWKEFQTILDDKSLLIHIPDLLNSIYEDLPCNMRCTIFRDIHNVTIDADGSFRLCLRIRGIDAPKLTYKNVIGEDGQWTQRFKDCISKDYFEYCRGCIWTCMYMSDKYSRSIIDHTE